MLDKDMDTGMPPISLNSTIGSYTSEANFDNNMVIVLAALLCALICALGLNSAIRCAIRCGYTFGLIAGTPHPQQTPVSVRQQQDSISTAGVKKSALSRIPVIAYDSSGSGGGLDNLTGTDCPICLGEFAQGDKVRILPNCSHGFHAKCIDIWLLSNSSCPLCRQALLAEDQVNFVVGRLPENAPSTGQTTPVLVT
ncbi:Zinc finger, RING-type [Corchorus capsularis]|uniref:RING-type E3 ubiquitin transferase n=1 Tax=Corchorus capsularis TaxID=210143 RepID=A0A1R3IK88_COCAP|nr:Zinc finger, RING-type [Corchorus capsularis]